MSAPHEIVAGPLELWVAPAGENFPAVDATPAGNWKKIGTSGPLNYHEDGVTAKMPQTIESFTPAGGTHQRKAWRTEDGLTFEVKVADFAPEQFALVYDDATVTTTPAASATPGTKSIDLGRGIEVHVYALLARGASPVDNSMVAQFQVDACYQNGEIETVWKKGEPVAVAAEFVALEATVGDFAELVVQTAAATS